MMSQDLLESCFSFYLTWSIIGGIPQDKDGNPLPLVASWTRFNKQILWEIFQKTLIKSMPITPIITVLKLYLFFLVEIKENLEIKHIFNHCDQAVYSKLLQVIWMVSTRCFACKKQFIDVMPWFRQMNHRCRYPKVFIGCRKSR